MKAVLKKIRNAYVIAQVQKARLPAFEHTGGVKRYRVVFSGRVQKVGFRLEVCELAKRLALTGFCQNLHNGDVLAELQGPGDSIAYVISFMESLKRIKISGKSIEELGVDQSEDTFFMRRSCA